MSLPGTKYLSLWGPVKLENKLTASKMRRWDRQGIGFPSPRWGKKGPLVSSKFRTQQGKFRQVSRPGNNPMGLHALTSRATEAPGKVRSALLSGQCVPTCGAQKPDMLPSSHPVSVHSSPSWQCSCWNDVLINPVGLPWMSQVPMLPDTRVLRGFFLDQPIPVPYSCCNGSGTHKG